MDYSFITLIVIDFAFIITNLKEFIEWVECIAFNFVIAKAIISVIVVVAIIIKIIVIIELYWKFIDSIVIKKIVFFT